VGKLDKYKLDLGKVQQVRWEGDGYQRAENCIFFYGKGTGFFIHNRIISAVERVDFISDSIFYITLKVRWFHIVLYVHAPTEDKNDVKKVSFYEELEQVFHQVPT
jgi:hypothetical protein